MDVQSLVAGSVFARWILSRFALLISLVALLLSLAALVLVVSQTNGKSEGVQSLFAAPDDLEQLITKVKQSLVTVECGDAIGSGWVTELNFSDITDPSERALVDEYPTGVVTNHHVIEDCVSDATLPRTVLPGATGLRRDFEIWNWDEENDLALILVAARLKPLAESSEEPKGGWWALAIGSPWEFNSSVSIGNIISTASEATKYDIISSALLNPGNSGGPLVNSRGEVVGTNTWSVNESELGFFSISVENRAICEVLVDCGK